MMEFKIRVENRPGELAKVAEVLANSAVNIKAISSDGTAESKGFLRVVTNDIRTAEKALGDSGIKFEQNEILALTLIDRPGELAKVSKKLAKAKINIHSIYILSQKNGKTELALVVDDIKKAQERLT